MTEVSPPRATRTDLPPCQATGALLQVVGGLANGGVTLAIGALARLLSGGSHLASTSLAMTWMSRVCEAVPWLHGRDERAGLALAVVGLVFVAIRSVTNVALARRDVLAGAHAAATARKRLVEVTLAGPQRPWRSVDVPALSIGAITTWPAEIGAGVRASRARNGAFVQLGFLVALALSLDPVLCAALLLALVPFALVLRPIRRALREAHADASTSAVALVDATRDLVEHAPVWGACGGGDTVRRRVDELGRDEARLSARAAAGQGLASASNEVVAALAIVVLVALFAPSTAAARPTLVPVLVALLSVYRPLRALAESSGVVERGRRAAALVAELQAPVGSRPKADHPPAGALVVRSLALDVGGARVRAGLDLDASPGAPLAIVGPPGAGKSAVLEALAGVRAVRVRGLRIEHAGVDFADAPLGPRHRPVAWVPPTAAVLPGSLAENLAPDAPTDRRRLETARAALVALGDRVLSALPDHAELGPRGRRPSSGEAQRLALARAIASDQPVLLLDEPTANLDADGEARAIALLARISKERTVVLVSHRPGPRAIARTIVDLADVDTRAPLAAVG